ncbi:MAG: hypothetical protein A2086_05370 [Spirochaetes bacterium GWD1_27_9]|nr:MAG: hypothetical protein A2Y34_10375 [Spirochaetes bacterium GWC1_27_15]OHD45607.1 MAG: hypothetical protein A2086_05370 [Spirochaetes bacterium GWD1_27_9]
MIKKMNLLQKFILLLFFPLISYVFCSILLIKTSLSDMESINIMYNNILLLKEGSNLIHNLQKERGETNIYLNNSMDLQELNKQRDETNKALEIFVKTSENIMKKKSEDILKNLDTLQELRKKIDNKEILFTDSFDNYTQKIGYVFNVYNFAASSKTTKGIGKIFTSLSLLEDTKENLGKFRGFVSGLLARNTKLSYEEMIYITRLKIQIESNLQTKAFVLSEKSNEEIGNLTKGENWTFFNDIFSIIFNQYTKGNFNIDSKVFFKNLTKIVDKMESVLTKELELNYTKLNSYKIETQTNLTISIALLFLVFIFIIFLSIIILNSILKPTKEITKDLNEINKGHGDLTKKLKILSDDEIGKLSISFNSFVYMLNSMIKEIKNSIEKTKTISMTLVSSSEESFASMEEINANMTNIKTKSTNLDNELNNLNNLSYDLKKLIENLYTLISSQSEEITTSSSAIEEMIASITSVSNTTEMKLELFDDLQNIAISGEKEMTETINVIKKVTDSTNVIMEMLKVINNIASQTNLLAMNAAIEAAHAGEYGKGFAVVAGEIRSLAEDTAKNSKEITLTLKNVIQDINISEKSSSKTGDYFHNIVTGIKETRNTMFEIKNSMGELTLASNQILTSLSSLIDKTDKVKKSSDDSFKKINNITSSFDNIKVVSEDTKYGIEEISVGLQEIYKSIEMISNSGEENSLNVLNIESLVNNFKV